MLCSFGIYKSPADILEGTRIQCGVPSSVSPGEINLEIEVRYNPGVSLQTYAIDNQTITLFGRNF